MVGPRQAVPNLVTDGAVRRPQEGAGRLRARLGAPKAITAMAHKLARLVYRMLQWGHEYVDKGLRYCEERHRQQTGAISQEESSQTRSANHRTSGLIGEVSGDRR